MITASPEYQAYIKRKRKRNQAALHFLKERGYRGKWSQKKIRYELKFCEECDNEINFDKNKRTLCLPCRKLRMKKLKEEGKNLHTIARLMNYGYNTVYNYLMKGEK